MRQELSERARKLTGAAGAAVYFCNAGQSSYEASVAWSCDDAIPDSPFSMRQVFEWLRESGDALVFPDLTARPLAALPPSLQRSVRALVAVPILGADNQVIGGICVFDVRPLAIGGAELDALRALARTAAARDTGVAIVDRSVAESAVARELARARREQRPLSVVLFEMSAAAGRPEPRGRQAEGDPFDAAIESLIRTIRGTDVPIRWRPGEVLLVLPGLALSDARPVAERVRAAMHAGARRQLSIAGGVAELTAADDTFDAVVERAEERLRTARERGHNRIA
jgi:diguanylate cyclase (GGDEF)-like protein